MCHVCSQQKGERRKVGRAAGGKGYTAWQAHNKGYTLRDQGSRGGKHVDRVGDQCGVGGDYWN